MLIPVHDWYWDPPKQRPRPPGNESPSLDSQFIYGADGGARYTVEERRAQPSFGSEAVRPMFIMMHADRTELPLRIVSGCLIEGILPTG